MMYPGLDAGSGSATLALGSGIVFSLRFQSIQNLNLPFLGKAKNRPKKCPALYSLLLSFIS